MNERRDRILTWLREVGPELAELYEGAVKMVEDTGFSGRGRFICHAVREIRNRLTDVVAGRLDVEQFKYKEEIEVLAKAWENEGLEGAYEKDSGGESSHAVPRLILVLVNQLVRKHRNVAGTNREKARRLLVELEPENKTLQGSLYPVVGAWFDVTEWFVDRAHVGKNIDDDDLVAYFRRFENAIYSIIGYFYEGMDDIERITNNANALNRAPSEKEINDLVLRLGRAKYRMYFFDKLKNPHWVKSLKDRKFFESPKEPQKGESYEQWPQGWYLKKMASKVPAEVLSVIKKVKRENPFVRNECLDCLLEMPEDEAAKGVGLVKDFLGERQYLGDREWFWEGQKAAELMVKLAESGKKEAFDIAYVLLDVWIPRDEKRASWYETKAKFNTYHYMELVLKYYKRVWDMNPERAVGTLIRILDMHLKEINEGQNYDISENFYIEMENLDEIGRVEREYIATLVKGICEAGKAVIKKQPEKIKELFECLRGKTRAIFDRIEMYLLRFVTEGTHKERIIEILLDKERFKSRGFRYEYDFLLRDKIDEVRDKVEETYKKWIEEIKVEDLDIFADWFEKTRSRKHTQEDLEKYESRMKAARLYLVREKFPDIYKRYKEEAGASDEDLMPKPMFIMTGDASLEKESPKSIEDMMKMEPADVLDYLLNPANYEGRAKPGHWHEPKEALQYVFGEVVRQRILDYVDLGLNEKLIKMAPAFLDTYFNRIMGAIGEKELGETFWGPWLELACIVTEGNLNRVGYRGIFGDILQTMEDGFRKRNKIRLDIESAKKMWRILKTLIKYEDDEEENNGGDPMHANCRSVRGRTVQVIVLFGIECKKGELYKGDLVDDIRKAFSYIAKEVRKPGVNCMFGTHFSAIYWLDSEWLEHNLDAVLADNMWDAVWGSYVSWGRPSPQCFELLVEKGIYSQAVDRIGKKNKYKFSKEPDEGLVEHLMIGYFNGWVDLESDVLKQFFEKASQELRGKAAGFLTTGFKPTKEGDNEKYRQEVAERMRAYWTGRLTAIKTKPDDNKAEAIEFTGWVEDSLLPAKETLELLEQSLDLSGGKIGEMRDARDFVEGVCKLGNGNELLALRCLKKAAADKNMHQPWSDIQVPLVHFLEAVTKLEADVRREGAEVADLYGRYNPDKFRPVWEQLRENSRSDKSTGKPPVESQ